MGFSPTRPENSDPGVDGSNGSPPYPDRMAQAWTMLLLRFLYEGVEFVIHRFELNVAFTLVHSAGYNDPVVVSERHVSSPGKRD